MHPNSHFWNILFDCFLFTKSLTPDCLFDPVEEFRHACIDARIPGIGTTDAPARDAVQPPRPAVRPTHERTTRVTLQRTSLMSLQQKSEKRRLRRINIAIQRSALRCVALRCVALRCVALRCVAILNKVNIK